MLQVDHGNHAHQARFAPSPSVGATHSPAAADAELLALGEKLNPMFERWSRHVAPLSNGVTVPAREKAYEFTDRLRRRVDESGLVDEILSHCANTPEGLAVQVKAAMLDLDLDALFFDPDPRIEPFFRSLCAFTGVRFPQTQRQQSE
jgi:hypothetical protein